MNEIVNMFDRYSRLPSSKSIEGLSKTYSVPLRKVLIDYIAEYHEFKAMTFIEWLNDSKYSYSSKVTFARGIASFANKTKVIDGEDKKFIYSKFRQMDNDWSSQVLTAQNIVDMMSQVKIESKDVLIRSRNNFIIMTLSAVGIRVAQLCGIEEPLVKVENEVVWLPVIQQKQIQRSLKKNSELKPIPLAYSVGNIDFKSVYEKYISIRDIYAKTDKLVINSNGQSITPRSVQLMIASLGNKIGIKVTPHTFRHYTGQRVANKYGILKAQILLGHHNIATTQKYLNPELINISEAI